MKKVQARYFLPIDMIERVERRAQNETRPGLKVYPATIVADAIRDYLERPTRQDRREAAAV